MTHFTPRNEHVPRWPIGSSITVKFSYDGDESDFIARAALIKVSTELKENIESAAKLLSTNRSLRTVQFYWPFEVISNKIYGQPIPKVFSKAIQELLDSEFSEAISDEIARNAIQRVCSLDAITWFSVERNPFITCGGTVSIGCTLNSCFDFTTHVHSLSADSQVPNHLPRVDSAKQLVRAIEDFNELTLQLENNKVASM